MWGAWQDLKSRAPNSGLKYHCPRSHGRIQEVDPPWSSITHTTGRLESRIRGSTSWICPEVCRVAASLDTYPLLHFSSLNYASLAYTWYVPRPPGGSKKSRAPQFWTLIPPWCRLQNLKVDLLFGSAQGSG